MSTDLSKIVALYVITIGTSGKPNSRVWLEIDPQVSDLITHQAIVGALIQHDIVREQFSFLTLTDKGLRLYEKIRQLYMPDVEKAVKNSVSQPSKTSNA